MHTKSCVKVFALHNFQSKDFFELFGGKKCIFAAKNVYAQKR